MSKRRDRRGMPGAVSLARIDELLAQGPPHNPGFTTEEPVSAPPEHKPVEEKHPGLAMIAPAVQPFRVERLVAPESVDRLTQCLTELTQQHGVKSKWLLLGSMAWPALHPYAFGQILGARPELADLPHDQLEAAFKRGCAGTAATPQTVINTRFTISNPKGNHPLIAQFVLSTPDVQRERMAASATLGGLIGQKVPKGASLSFTVGYAAPDTFSHHREKEAFARLGGEHLARIGGVVLEGLSIFYPMEGVRRPLY